MAKKSNRPVAAHVAQGKSTDVATASSSKFSLSRRLALLLGIISFFVYSNTLNNGFVLDDQVMIVYNKYVTQGISAIPDLLTTPHQRGFHVTDNDEYRPLPLVMHAITYQFFGLNAVPYHFLNILLFAGCVILLFRFLNKLFDGKKVAVAFVASLLFALHPLHTEVVANVKSGDELLCFFFTFLAMNIFLKYVQAGKPLHLLAGFLGIFLAYLSKETVVTFLAIIPLVFFFHQNEHKKRSVYILCSMALATIIFMVIRFSVLEHYQANNMAKVSVIENALAKDGLSVASRIATAILILGKYLKLLVVPFPLVSEYSYNAIPFTHFGNPLVLLSLTLYLAIAVFGVWRFVKDRRDPYAFGIFFFLVTIALFSNVLFLIKSTMGERFLFFPSVGFCLVAALLIEKLAGANDQGMGLLMRTKVLAVVVPVCIIYSAIVVDRNKDWVDNYTLYSTDLKKTPENAHMNYLLGYELFSMSKQEKNPMARENMLNDAIKYMRKSATILPEYFYAQTDLGAAYFTKGRYDSAEVYDMAALKLFPDAVVSRNNLSGLFIATKQFRRNIGHCKETIRLTKDNPNAYADMGVSYMNLGMTDSAIYYLRLGIRSYPEFYGCYDVLAYLYKMTGNIDSSIKYQRIVQEISRASR